MMGLYVPEGSCCDRFRLLTHIPACYVSGGIVTGVGRVRETQLSNWAHLYLTGLRPIILLGSTHPVS